MIEKRPVLLQIVVFLFIFGVSTLIFFQRIPHRVEIQPDMIMQFLMPKDCLNDNCFTALAPNYGTDYRAVGIHNGPLIIHITSTILFFGGSLITCYYFIAILNALAAAVFFFFIKYFTGLLEAIIGWAAYILIFGPHNSHTVNFVLIPFSAIYFLSAGILYLEKEDPRLLIAATLSIAIGITSYSVFLANIPALIFLIAYKPREKLLKKAFFIFIVGFGYMLVSAPAQIMDTNILNSFDNTFFPHDSRYVNYYTIYFFFFFSLIIIFSAAFFTKKFLKNNIILFLLICYVPLFILIRLVYSEIERYIYSLLPGIIFLILYLVYIILKKIKTFSINICGVILKFVLASLMLFHVVQFISSNINRYQEKYSESFSMEDAETGANYFSQKVGLTYEQLFRHIKGDINKWIYINGLAYYMPLTKGKKDIESETLKNDIFIIKAPTESVPGSLPSNWNLIYQKKYFSLLAANYSPYLNWDVVDMCLISREDPSECIFSKVEVKYKTTAHKLNPELFATRTCPSIINTFDYNDKYMMVKVPINIPAKSEARTILIPNEKGEPGCPGCSGKIISVHGVRYQGKLPSDSVNILSHEYAKAGAIQILWDKCNDSYEPLLIPPVIELNKRDLNIYQQVTKYREKKYEHFGQTIKYRNNNNVDLTFINELVYSTKKEQYFNTFVTDTRPLLLMPLWYVISVEVATLIIIINIIIIIMFYLTQKDVFKSKNHGRVGSR